MIHILHNVTLHKTGFMYMDYMHHNHKTLTEEICINIIRQTQTGWNIDQTTKFYAQTSLSLVAWRYTKKSPKFL